MEPCNSVGTAAGYGYPAANHRDSRVKHGNRKQSGFVSRLPPPCENSPFAHQPVLDRAKSSRSRQKANRPSLNSSDLDVFSMANNGNYMNKNWKLSSNHLLNFSFPYLNMQSFLF